MLYYYSIPVKDFLIIDHELKTLALPDADHLCVLRQL